MDPLVSIVTIVFNGERYLSQTIQSVVRQTYSNIEYVVIDGGSKDGTLDVIKQNEAHISFWLSEKDGGLADAMNKSIQYCHGKYIMFLHADDQLVPDAISILVSALSGSDKKWAMGFYKYIDSKDHVIKEDGVRGFTFFDMELRNIVRHQATIVPLEIFEKISFMKKYKYALDYMFFLELWEMLGGPAVVRKHLTYFRLDGNNLSSNFYASIRDEMCVRKDFRRSRKQGYKLLFDYVIYGLRLLKIYVYHKRVRNVG